MGLHSPPFCPHDLPFAPNASLRYRVDPERADGWLVLHLYSSVVDADFHSYDAVLLETLKKAARLALLDRNMR